MNANHSCPQCGSSNLEQGRVQSTGLLNFRPASPRFITVRTADVPVIASMCLECGAIQLVGEVSKARKLSKKQQS